MKVLKELFVEVTNRCCQKCVHCSSSAQFKNYPEISLDNLKGLVNQGVPLGLERMTLSGGEPFLYKDLLPAVKYFGEKGLTTSVYTCGVILSHEGAYTSIDGSIFKTLQEHGLKRVIFSLHGATAARQDFISQTPGSFDLVMKSITAAVHSGVEVELHTVPMRYNLNDIENIFDIAVAQKIKKVSLLRFVPQGRGTKVMEPTRADYLHIKKMYSVWQKKYSTLQIRMGAPYNCLSLAGKACTAGIDKLLINAWGEYFPCEAFKFMHGIRPTIYNRRLNIEWENDPLLKALREIDIDKVTVCSSCAYQKECAGGCAGQRMHRNGSMFVGPDPSCLMRETGE